MVVISDRTEPPACANVAAVDLIEAFTNQVWAGWTHSVGPENCRVLSEAAEKALRDGLRARLLFTGGQTLRFYSSALSAATFHDLPSSTNSRDVATPTVEGEAIFRHYPGLHIIWRRQLARWRQTTSEFVAAVHSFAESRRAERIAGIVEAVEPDISDPHDGNRCGMRTSIRGAGTWFYKPRSGERERLFYTFLQYLSDAGFRLDFKAPQVVSCRGYHWSEEVEHRSCAKTAEVESFFFRAGGLLYALHLLRAVDIHAGNLVAHGEYPIIVDCETLLHPDGGLPERYASEDESMMRVGMLPTRSQHGSGVSALGRTTVGPHSPLLRGASVDARDFVPHIVTGFQEMHRTVQQIGTRDPTLRSLIAELLATPTRLILRPSSEYHRLLVRSFEPSHLQTRAGRALFLAAASDIQTLAAGYRRAETAALACGDIPRLMTNPCHPRSLRDSEAAAAVTQIRHSFAHDGI